MRAKLRTSKTRAKAVNTIIDLTRVTATPFHFCIDGSIQEAWMG
jgi:hypothetical protein